EGLRGPVRRAAGQAPQQPPVQSGLSESPDPQHRGPAHVRLSRVLRGHMARHRLPAGASRGRADTPRRDGQQPGRGPDHHDRRDAAGGSRGLGRGSVPLWLRRCDRAHAHLSLRRDQRLRAPPSRAPGRRGTDDRLLRRAQFRRPDLLTDHHEHRVAGQCVPPGNRVRAVRPHRRRGQALVSLRRARARRRPRAPRRRRRRLLRPPPAGPRGEPMPQYWDDVLAALARYPARPEIEPLPLRSTTFATLYGVRLTSLGPYRLFGYLSIPTGAGPFPAIYYPPKYQSVLEIIPQGTANLQRSRYITFSLAGRGQRNADTPFAAMFPGLLTGGIDTAASYVFRGIVADAIRGLAFLLTRRELDAARVVLVGNDVALFTAALTPGATHVVATPALFYKTAELAVRTQTYPLEEINDYLRMFPARAEAVRRTLAYYDLCAFAPRIAAPTLLMAGAPGTVLDGQALKPLIDALPGRVTVHESEQSLYRDGLYAEQWMAAQCGSGDSESILPEHWRD